MRVQCGVLTAGMALLVLARNGVLFLVGWEAMALAAFLLIATEHDKAPARRAAWVYLVATHLCTLCLAAAIALMAGGGGLEWRAGAFDALAPERVVLVFALATTGFLIKAGLMPLHVWLPAAHASAPSHVSAVLSGVMLKMGAYGVLRFCALLPPLPATCGLVVAIVAGISALLAVAATLGQSDVKRLLAYSSIENLGIVFCGIGLALVGRSLGITELVVLGLGGGLFHVLNHALFKPLLFLAAGSIVHATGTREIDQLGGLARRMPRTALAFVVGAAAICGLPPLCGFAGEFALYLGLFRAATLDGPWIGALGIALLACLAMVGGLAVVAFVRCTATIFLGAPRSPHAAHAHESPRTVTGTLFVLAALCVAVGLAPWTCVPLLDLAIAPFLPPSGSVSLGALVPFGIVSAIAFATAIAVAGGLLWLRNRARRVAPATARVGTWDCGFVDASSPRLQYTGSSFAQFATRVLGWAVRERRESQAPLELFPAPHAFRRHAREPLLHDGFEPFLHRVAERCTALRFLQRGKLHVYLLYILAVLLLLLAWSTLVTRAHT
ncbi:MAG: hypothetical protein HZB39_21475 [Planctomycetes bacterium]|nr:hypothetical protein [Planctomycetota bacterium]